MTVRARLLLLALATLFGALVATPAYASTGSDLVVHLSDKVDAKPGKRVTYTVTVHNKGPSPARRVRIYFKTSTPLAHITFDTAKGSCRHSPKEAVCTVGVVRKSRTVIVNISGVLPGNLKPDAAVTSRATVTSSTPRIYKHDDVATDTFKIETSSLVPLALVPTPTVTGKIGPAAGAVEKVFSFSRRLARLTFILLGAGVLWFAAGLALRWRSRARRGITNH